MSAHGTKRRYDTGCRCLDCGAANRTYQRTYRERQTRLIAVNRPLLAEALNEMFPEGLTDDCPRARARQAA
jgi:hypothetical protein